MQPHSEFYTFATHFWWLIFPIGWGLAGLLRACLNHNRTQQAFDLLNTYAQQNREPPAEVLAMLQPRSRCEGHPADRRHRIWRRGFFFAALAAAFAALAVTTHGNNGVLVFIAVLMAGFSISMFLAGWIESRTKSQLPPTE